MDVEANGFLRQILCRAWLQSTALLAGKDQLSQEDQTMALINGNDLPDVLTGSAIADEINGLAGSDIIFGLGGNDTLFGGSEDDVIDGGSGNDTINTGPGNDFILGGSGNDTIAWNDPVGDWVFGDARNDILRGGDIAADTIFGGTGDDLIRAAANQSVAVHAADRDTIIGGNAGDLIEGGTGNDTMAGFGDADRFVFRNGVSGRDLIVDFDRSQDVIELTGLSSAYDPLDKLQHTASGARLDLGGGNHIMFFGVIAGELSETNFLIAWLRQAAPAGTAPRSPQGSSCSKSATPDLQ